jgi:hypothetical protein
MEVEKNLDLSKRWVKKDYFELNGYILERNDNNNDFKIQKIYKVWEKYCNLADYYNYYCDVYFNGIEEYKISY